MTDKAGHAGVTPRGPSPGSSTRDMSTPPAIAKPGEDRAHKGSHTNCSQSLPFWEHPQRPAFYGPWLRATLHREKGSLKARLFWNKTTKVQAVKAS